MAVALAEQTAVLIDRFYLAEQSQQMAKNLRLSYEASNTLVSQENPKEILRKIILRLQEFAQAAGVRFLLFDNRTEELDASFAVGIAEKLSETIRKNGLSLKILKTGKLQIVNQTQPQKIDMNPEYKVANIATSVGLPASIDKEIFGIVWVYFEQNRAFPNNYIEALQFFVNQAAIAYDHARRLALTEQLRQAMLTLTSASTTENLLQQILLQARNILKGDLTVIWLYDSQRNQFILSQSVFSGLTKEQWKQLKDAQPAKDGRVMQAMKQGWVGVENIMHIPDDFPVSQETVKRLKALEIQGFQAVSLAVGHEMLGILYINYHQPQRFAEDDEAKALTFGNQAGLALKNMMLVDKMQKTSNVAKTVASISVQSNIDDLLPIVTDEMRTVLDCDFVCLHVRDVFKQQFQQHHIHVGSIQISDSQEQDEEILIQQLMEKPLAIYIADDVEVDPIFRHNPFTYAEQIKSCLAVSLRVREIDTHNMGIILIGYRIPHNFTNDEIDIVQLFADQVAVAIHNALLLEHNQKQASELFAMSEITHSHLAEGDDSGLENLLQTTAKQAIQITAGVRDVARVSHVGIVKSNKIIFKATFPTNKLTHLQQHTPYLDLSNPEKPIGITGRAVSTKKAQRVGNVQNNDDYHLYDSRTQSEIAVPILSRKDDMVIGVINVEHHKLNAFDKRDEEALSRLAELVSIAIENIDSYTHQLRTVTSLRALHELGKTITRSKNIEEILASVAQQAWLLVRYGNQQIIYSQVWILNGQTLKMQATYPPEMIQERTRLELPFNSEGIIARAWHKKESQLVSFVNSDPDYYAYYPETQSELAIPMIFEGDVIGVINVEHSEVDAINQDNLQALEALASQATIAIQNANLYINLKEQYQDLNTLQSQTSKLAGALEFTEIINVAMSAARTIAQAQTCFMILPDFNDKLDIHYQLLNGSSHQISRSLESVFGQYLERCIEEKEMIDPSHGQTVKFVHLSSKLEKQVWLIVPIIQVDEVIAVMLIADSYYKKLTPHQITLLQALSNQVSSALEADKQKTTFLATISHELRKPLTPVIWGLDAMLEHKEDKTFQDDALVIALKGARKQRKLIDNLLDLSSMQANKLRLKKEPTDLVLLIKSSCNDLRMNIQNKRKQLEVYCELDMDSCIVDIDRVKIEGVIQNLLTNALKFTKKGFIRVSASYQTNKVKVLIQDTGQGIPQKDHNRIFIQFYRVDNSLSAETDGTGIGLALCKGFIRRHGGEIKVEKSIIGEGTTISFTLPLNEHLKWEI